MATDYGFKENEREGHHENSQSGMLRGSSTDTTKDWGMVDEVMRAYQKKRTKDVIRGENTRRYTSRPYSSSTLIQT